LAVDDPTDHFGLNRTGIIDMALDFGIHVQVRFRLDGDSGQLTSTTTARPRASPKGKMAISANKFASRRF